MEVELHNYYKCCLLNSCDSQPLVIWFMKVEEDLGATKLDTCSDPISFMAVFTHNHVLAYEAKNIMDALLWS